MTEKVIERQAPEAAAESGANSTLISELLAHTKQNGFSLNQAPGEQAQNLLGKASIEISNNCSPAMKDAAKPATLAQLSAASQEELACLYHNSAPGKIPEGNTDGQVIFMPGTTLGKDISSVANMLWTGKVFDGHGGLVNEILGQQIIAAGVSRGPSWLDGKQSTIIDYKNTSFLAGFIRDEIREVNPGLYLGVAYARLPFSQHVPALFFALDTNKNK